MADYRLIFRNAATGERTSSLSHLGFRVWVQYQLSADDFGVCAALAAKFQGDNPALADESARAVQAEIDRLVTLRLCGSFEDGKRRYLYQADWQDWQRLKHASSTTLPPIPAELLEKCSPKTRELFQQFHPKIRETFPPRARACDAPANASAHADASLGGAGGAVVRAVDVVAPALMRAPRVSPGSPADWGRRHGSHAMRGELCGWVCLPQSLFDEFVGKMGADEATGRAAVRTWALGVKDAYAGRVVAEGDVFKFWRNEWTATHGGNRPAAGQSLAYADPLAGVRELERREARGER